MKNDMSFHTYPPMKMKRTECSETSAYKIQTPGDLPRRRHTTLKKYTESVVIIIMDGRGYSINLKFCATEDGHFSVRKMILIKNCSCRVKFSYCVAAIKYWTTWCNKRIHTE